jgi:hypothetical protein
MPTAEITIKILRNDDTQAKADNKAQAAEIRFVTYLVPNVRDEITPLDFYVRNAAGEVQQNVNGKDRIQPAKLDAAVEKLMRDYFNGIVKNVVRQERQAAFEAELQALQQAEEA